MEIGKKLASVEVSDIQTRIICGATVIGLLGILFGQPDISTTQKIMGKSITASLRCKDHRRCSVNVIRMNTYPPKNYESRSIAVSWYGGMSGDFAYMIYVPETRDATRHGRIGFSEKGIRLSKYP